MTILEKELEIYSSTISVERLLSFKQNENDTIKILITRYKDNIRISQALYPELSALEITLRNAIDTMLKTCFSSTWLDDEILHQNILLDNEHQMLLNVYNDVIQKYPNNFTIGKVIANLSFGFWTNLCSKKYNAKIWTKKGAFKGVFINYPEGMQQQIHILSKKLRTIRNLRNRVFHYEPIFKKPLNTLKMYNEIIDVLNCLPIDNSDIILSTSTFLNVYNQIISQPEQQKT